jgi:hypothetical protein
MFTLSVIIFDVVSLIWAGIRILKRSAEKNYSSGKLLGWGLILVGFAILLYGTRSALTWFGGSQFYWADEHLLYRPGTVIHSIGLFIIFLFVYKEFTPKLFAKITAIPVLGSMIYMAYLFAFSPTNRVEKPAPLEPIKFMMTSYPWASPLVTRIFVYIIVGAPLIILGIFLYNAVKSERVKALFFGYGVPIIGFLGMVGVFRPKLLPVFAGSATAYKILFVLALLSLLVYVLIAKERKAAIKTLFYGLGISFEGLFIPLCLFISPTFARLGYGIGALMVYNAFNMKIRNKEES